MTRPRPRRSGLATALATLLVAAACGSTAPTPPASVPPSAAPASVAPSVVPTAAPSIAPTAAPTPSPTPTPGDAFLARVGDLEFAAAGTITGTLSLGGLLSLDWAGRFAIHGLDMDLLTALDLGLLGGTSSPREELVRVGLRRVRSSPLEAWSKATPVESRDPATLVGYLRAITKIEPAGSEIVDGRSLARFRIV